MGFFDKWFKKKDTRKGKIRIKFVEQKPDEHEMFLKDDNDLQTKKVTKPTSTKKTAADDNPPSVQKKITKKSEVIKTTSETKQTEAKVKIKTAPAKANAKPVIKATAAGDAAIAEGSVAVTESSSVRNGKFDIRRAKDGRYFFSLYASNYAVIAYSQIYSSSAAAMTGIRSVIANAAKTPIEDTTVKKPITKPFPKWEIYIDKAGEYRFRLYAQNGLCVCHSAHGYSTKGGCKGGIESIMRFASEAASIDKSYLK